MLSDKELLQKHIDAMFVRDAYGRLLAINEPWDKAKPAPIVFAGQTVGGQLCYSHSVDIGAEEAQELAMRCIKEEPLPKNFSVESAVCYTDVPQKEVSAHCVLLTKNVIAQYDLGEFGWLAEELSSAQPCVGYIVDNEVVSICRSVRVGKDAHEAGIETAIAHRKKGYAKQVLFVWANAVRGLGMLPLYSHLAGNTASQNLARSCELRMYARTYSIQ